MTESPNALTATTATAPPAVARSRRSARTGAVHTDQMSPPKFLRSRCSDVGSWPAIGTALTARMKKDLAKRDEQGIRWSWLAGLTADLASRAPKLIGHHARLPADESPD